MMKECRSLWIGLVSTAALLLSACGGGSDSAAAGSATAPTATPTEAATASWTECASEGGSCSFSGTRTVKYGTAEQSVTLTLTDGATCNNAVFGDPAVGALKSCWVDGTTVASNSTAPATPTTGGTATTAGGTSSGGTSSTAAAGPRVSSFTASGPITASAGQVISGVRISNANGPCITIPSGATGVVVRDSDIGPCGGSANIVVYGSGAVIEHVFVHNGNRGVLAQSTGGVVTRLSKFDTFYGPKYNGTAIEYDYMSSGEIDRNLVTGSSYASDAVSVYESSNMRLTNNTIDINVSEPSAAAFTMGDSTSGNPGSNNYVAYNTVKQSGGVPAGVFGSNSNTLLEKNCLSAGIQAYNYSGIFNGVTVRNNVINLSASFVPVTSVISGWNTNVNSTDCALVPA
jgi:hypothetical protein